MEIHLWPVYVARHSPDERRHFLSVLSQDPDTSASLSLGSNAMQVTSRLPWQLSVTCVTDTDRQQATGEGSPRPPYAVAQAIIFWSLDVLSRSLRL